MRSKCDGVYPSHLLLAWAELQRTEQRLPMITQCFPMIILAFLSVLLRTGMRDLLLDVQSDAAFVPALLADSLHRNVHRAQASRMKLMVFLGIYVYPHGMLVSIVQQRHHEILSK